MTTLVAIYPWVKALHVMAVIAWMAGLFYLPRLFVHHAESAAVGTPADRTFRVMEGKLLAVIMTPAMIVAWGAGLTLAMTPGVVDWSAVWPWTKLAGIVAMTVFHGWCAARRREFAAGANVREGRRYRIMNEVPTVLMVLIVLSVIVKF